MNTSHAPVSSSRASARLPALLSALMLALSLGACAAPAAEPAVSAVPVARLQQQIEAAIGDAACSSSAQCRTLPIGARACGGPERYLAWSTQRSDAAQLDKLAQALKAQREAENARSGMASTCQFLMDPGAQCVAGRCQLGGGAGGAQLQ